MAGRYAPGSRWSLGQMLHPSLRLPTLPLQNGDALEPRRNTHRRRAHARAAGAEMTFILLLAIPGKAQVPIRVATTVSSTSASAEASDAART